MRSFTCRLGVGVLAIVTAGFLILTADTAAAQTSPPPWYSEVESGCAAIAQESSIDWVGLVVNSQNEMRASVGAICPAIPGNAEQLPSQLHRIWKKIGEGYLDRHGNQYSLDWPTIAATVICFFGSNDAALRQAAVDAALRSRGTSLLQLLIPNLVELSAHGVTLCNGASPLTPADSLAGIEAELKDAFRDAQLDSSNYEEEVNQWICSAAPGIALSYADLAIVRSATDLKCFSVASIPPLVMEHLAAYATQHQTSVELELSHVSAIYNELFECDGGSEPPICP